MGISLGKPILQSLPNCKSPDDRRPCYEPEYSTAENVTDAYGLVSVGIKRGVVQEITVMISGENADLAYKDLVEKYGEPTDSLTSAERSWQGKHVLIQILLPKEKSPGDITVRDVDVKDDPVPPHKNTF